MPIETIEPRRLYRQVADQLRALIEVGEFGVGERLPAERDLAEQLGVSRPTVREALIALEVEGRVRIRVGSGIYVTAPPRAARHSLAAVAPDPAIEGPFELLRARAFVEGAVAAEAAERVTVEDVARLDAVLTRMAAVPHPSPDTLSLDREFHTTVTGILGNAVLVRFVGELFDQRVNPYFERLSRYFENPETWQLALDEHRAVRDAIVAGDPDGARAAMQRHLRESQRRFSIGFGDTVPAAVADVEEAATGTGP